MIVIHESAAIPRPPVHVFAVVSDMGNRVEWEEGLASSEFTSTGPVKVGSTARTVAMRYGRAFEGLWTVTELQAPERFTIEGVAGGVPCVVQYTVRATDQGSRLDVRFESRPAGWRWLLTPILRRVTHKPWSRSIQRLAAWAATVP